MVDTEVWVTVSEKVAHAAHAKVLLTVFSPATEGPAGANVRSSSAWAPVSAAGRTTRQAMRLLAKALPSLRLFFQSKHMILRYK